MITIRTAQMQAMAAQTQAPRLIEPCPATRTWIAFQMLDMEDKPVPGLAYEVTLPDSAVVTGVLDDDGTVRFDPIVAGNGKIRFPDLDQDAWEPL
jgi:hypothetical protein